MLNRLNTLAYLLRCPMGPCILLDDWLLVQARSIDHSICTSLLSQSPELVFILRPSM